jgi:hypothetical protein
VAIFGSCLCGGFIGFFAFVIAFGVFMTGLWMVLDTFVDIELFRLRVQDSLYIEER